MGSEEEEVEEENGSMDVEDNQHEEREGANMRRSKGKVPVRGKSKGKGKSGDSGTSEQRDVDCQEEGDGDNVRSKGKVLVGGRSKGKGKRSEQGESEGGGDRSRGSTKSYGRFELHQWAFLRSIFRYCIDRFGLNMGPLPASEFQVDISKYLYFASMKLRPNESPTLNPEDLVDADSVKDYLHQLDEDGIGSSGQLTKLVRIEVSGQFALKHCKWGSRLEAKCLTASSLFQTWKRMLQKEKTAAQKAKRPEMSNNLPSDEYMKILDMPEPVQDIKTILRKESPTPKEYSRCMAFLAMHLYFRCAQRKSAVECLTVDEFQNARREMRGDKAYWLVLVKHHETATSLGPAPLIVSDELKPLYDRFNQLRSGRGDSDLFFVNNDGNKPSRLPSLVQAFAREYQVSLPALTTHCKVVATKAAALPEHQQEKVAALMSHSVATQKRYYRQMLASKNQTEAFEVMQEKIHQKQPQQLPRARYQYSAGEEKLILDHFSQQIKTNEIPQIKQNECLDKTLYMPLSQTMEQDNITIPIPCKKGHMSLSQTFSNHT